MPDLREPLSRYAESLQPSHTPPFAAVREKHRRRRRRRGATGAAGVALAAAAGIVVVPQLTGTSLQPAIEQPVPDTITVKGRTLNLEGPRPVGAARPAGDTLLVTVDGPPTEDWNSFCQPYVVVRVASEDARSVQVVAYYYSAPEAAVAFCASVATSSQRSVGLDAGLGDREVVDATDNRRLWPAEDSSEKGR